MKLESSSAVVFKAEDTSRPVGGSTLAEPAVPIMCSTFCLVCWTWTQPSCSLCCGSPTRHVLKGEGSRGVAPGVALLVPDPGLVQVLHESILMRTGWRQQNTNPAQQVHQRLCCWWECDDPGTQVPRYQCGSSPENSQGDVLFPRTVFSHSNSES